MAVRKTKAGLALKRWFKEDGKDVRTGKACGRRKGEKRGTPYCRPSKRVSSKKAKKKATGGVVKMAKGGFIARGCGQVENSRRKRTRTF